MLKNFPSLIKYFTALSLLTISVGPIWAQGKYEVAGVDDEIIVTEFLSTLQKKVIANDRTSIAGMVDYPLSVTVSGKKYILKTPKDFLAKYDIVVNKNVQNAILKTTEPFAKCDGIMLGDHGEVWLNLAAPDFKVLKIGTINPD
jgi:hypothetical protein